MRNISIISLPVLVVLLNACTARDSCDGKLWGRSTALSAGRAADDLRRCAERDHHDSQVYLGRLLALNGKHAESGLWLERAAHGRGAEGAFRVANQLRSFNDDNGLAEEWYRRAFELGKSEAALELGLLLHKNGQRAEANRWFGKAVERGGGWAANSIGLRLFRQLDDAATAATWYNRGAQMGERNSMSEYARMLEGGIGVATDPIEAFRWRLRAVSHVHADGYDLLALARAYDEGIGTARDPRAALEAVRLAKGKRIDDSDFETPKRMKVLENRLTSEL